MTLTKTGLSAVRTFSPLGVKAIHFLQKNIDTFGLRPSCAKKILKKILIEYLVHAYLTIVADFLVHAHDGCPSLQ
jgi:hypothetical protein